MFRSEYVLISQSKSDPNRCPRYKTECEFNIKFSKWVIVYTYIFYKQFKHPYHAGRDTKFCRRSSHLILKENTINNK